MPSPTHMGGTLGRAAGVVGIALLGACGDPGVPAARSTGTHGLAAAELPREEAKDRDSELGACRARIEEVMKLPALPGAPAFEAARVEILGRARGEPMVFVREPMATADEALPPAWLASRRTFERAVRGGRVHDLLRRHRREPAALRALLLREGYVLTEEPLDAYEIVAAVEVAHLFDEPEIWAQRGGETHRLVRVSAPHAGRFAGGGGGAEYRHAEGPMAGRRAELLFGDRLASRPEELSVPLHRDFAALADVEGFDRARLLHRTEGAVVAELRFGAPDLWAKALLESSGATLRLACIAAGEPGRAAVAARRAREEPFRRAMARIRLAVSEQVAEALRFDRPEGEKSPDRDGELRPIWLSAYLAGRGSYEVDGTGYLVYDAEGRPTPPQVCMDFVLDTFERASGTWYRARSSGGARPGRDVGGLDWSVFAAQNRRGVIGFGTFAESRPDLFEVRRFQGAERIPFRDRARFFRFLEGHADDVREGDLVSIQGMKRDDRIHQHAILVERTDPLTGFPHGLADQMKRPRRRTWEGIMAEAPARSLFYRARPTADLLTRVHTGPEALSNARKAHTAMR